MIEKDCAFRILGMFCDQILDREMGLKERLVRSRSGNLLLFSAGTNNVCLPLQ
jgi:hypothetical protein